MSALRAVCIRSTGWYHLKTLPKIVKCHRSVATYSNRDKIVCSNWSFDIGSAEFDEDVIFGNAFEAYKENIKKRHGTGNIQKARNLYRLICYHEKLTSSPNEAVLDDASLNIDVDDYFQSEEVDLKELKTKLQTAIRELPNLTHPEVPIGDESQAKVLDVVNTRKEFDFEVKGAVELGTSLDCLRTRNVGLTSGPKSYYFMTDFALLQDALINYTIDFLKLHGFEFIAVPELVHPSVIEACGFPTTGDRTQVYHLASPNRNQNICLTGTGEMPLASLFLGHHCSLNDLPKRVMTISKCFRAETSSVDEEQGIYRVHQFFKVEMFALTSSEKGNESQQMMDEILSLQKQLFSSLGLHIRVLDMPTEELGAPAYRKYDIETWMPHKQFWGEISSTSNCTDFQSRRLKIKYWDQKDVPKFAHTVNGTGCAVPRVIMAIAETFQTKEGFIEVPFVLQPYMNNLKMISGPAHRDQTQWIKLTKSYKEKIRVKP